MDVLHKFEKSRRRELSLRWITIVVVGLLFSSCDSTNQELDINYLALKSSFEEPQYPYGPRCWWWWLNSNVTKEAITRDLEAMQDKGFSGAMVFDAGTELWWGPDENPPNGPQFGSSEWIDLFLHALAEADRLDLKLGLSIQSGWNLGGPTVTLDDKAKQITWSEIQVRGPGPLERELPLPPSNYDYYRDIAVLAFPYKPESDQPIRDLEAKSGARELGGSAPDCRFLLDDYPATPDEENTSLDQIVNLTDRLHGDRIEWSVPEGKWTILRIGYTPTEAHVATSSDNWKGHVLDYLSEKSFTIYWQDNVDPILKASGEYVGDVLTHLETDSWECGGMNWSPHFATSFADYNGYDIVKYLPVVCGKIVDSREVSNAFLADLRKTIAHFVSENHYKTFSELAASYGLGIQPESSGPHAGPLDGITNYSHSDIPMSEFWSPSPHRPNPENRYFVKQAASAAHIYGKQLVGAESFTTLRKPHWSVKLWYDLKPHMDYEFCEGLNMIFFHTFTCSPQEMGIPGQEYFAGTHINPQVTWWSHSDPFMEYITRVQTILQQSSFNADVIYYYGDHVPNIAVYKGFNQAGCLPGYDYDVTNEEILLQLEVTDEGTIKVPGEIEYKVLVLPDHRVLSLDALKRVADLLQQGATVLGPKPNRLVSLVGGNAAQQQFHILADSLWGDQPEAIGQRILGSGKLVWGINAREYLKRQAIVPDFEILDSDNQQLVEWIHLTKDDLDIYFITNQSDRAQSIQGAFRMQNKVPEIWDPVNGSIHIPESFHELNNQTIIPIQFDPFGSYFIVFSAASQDSYHKDEIKVYIPSRLVHSVHGPWKVGFDPRWGGPNQIVFDSLFDWRLHDSASIQFYSGKATYSTTFNIQPEASKKYWVQLNRVEDTGIAAIRVNDGPLQKVWTKPFLVPITEYLKNGQNTIEVEVINSWQNRLIGDRGKPSDDRYTQTNIKIKEEWRLKPGGLLGPVEIWTH